MKHVVDDLSALLDGALDPAARRTVEAHLAACAACRAEHGRLRGALSSLGRLPPPPEPSPWFATRLAARLAEEPRRGWFARLAAWRWRLALPAAGLAGAALAGVLMVRHQRGLELGAAAELELLENYELVASLGVVETADDAELIAHLDTVVPGGGR
jgi:anti-sigma factor RsiW